MRKYFPATMLRVFIFCNNKEAYIYVVFITNFEVGKNKGAKNSTTLIVHSHGTNNYCHPWQTSCHRKVFEWLRKFVFSGIQWRNVRGLYECVYQLFDFQRRPRVEYKSIV